LVGLVHTAFSVEQDCEIAAGFFEPLLHGGERSKGNHKNARVQFGKFGLLVAQLCDMLAAGNSAKVTEKD
jgi:hypothetical protein